VARYRWCRQCEEWHEPVRYRRNCDPEPPQRGDYPTPYIISDTLPGGVNGIMHHAVGRQMDSKSAFRRATKDAGCIEVGNEYVATTKRPDVQIRENVIAAGVNEALARHGITSESDTGKLDYGSG
jgi:hypothetical protein